MPQIHPTQNFQCLPKIQGEKLKKINKNQSAKVGKFMSKTWASKPMKMTLEIISQLLEKLSLLKSLKIKMEDLKEEHSSNSRPNKEWMRH